MSARGRRPHFNANGLRLAEMKISAPPRRRRPSPSSRTRRGPRGRAGGSSTTRTARARRSRRGTCDDRLRRPFAMMFRGGGSRRRRGCRADILRENEAGVARTSSGLNRLRRFLRRWAESPRTARGDAAAATQRVRGRRRPLEGPSKARTASAPAPRGDWSTGDRRCGISNAPNWSSQRPSHLRPSAFYGLREDGVPNAKTIESELFEFRDSRSVAAPAARVNDADLL